MALSFSRIKGLLVLFTFILDVALTSFSFVLSYQICTLITPDIDSANMMVQLPLIIILTSFIFIVIGSYKGFVKFDKIKDVYNVFNAICLSNMLTIIVVIVNGELMLEQNLIVPLSIIIVHSILSFTALVFSRLFYKRIVLRVLDNLKKKQSEVLI